MYRNIKDEESEIRALAQYVSSLKARVEKMKIQDETDKKCVSFERAIAIRVLTDDTTSRVVGQCNQCLKSMHPQEYIEIEQ